MISTCGFHGSNSSSLPMIHARYVTVAAAATTPIRPARSQATATTVHAAMTLTSITPSATPAWPPKTRTGAASASNSSGPGWFMFTPASIDAEVHVPSNGWSTVSTSRARMATSASSPIGIQPSITARIAATTIGRATTINPTTSTGSIRRHRARRPTPSLIRAYQRAR